MMIDSDFGIGLMVQEQKCGRILLVLSGQDWLLLLLIFGMRLLMIHEFMVIEVAKFEIWFSIHFCDEKKIVLVFRAVQFLVV